MSVSHYTSLLSEVRLIWDKDHNFDGLQIRKASYLSYITTNRQIIYRAIPANQHENAVLVKRDIVSCFAICMQYKTAAIN